MQNTATPRQITRKDRQRTALQTEAISTQGFYSVNGKNVQLPGHEFVTEVEHIPASSGGPAPCADGDASAPVYILANTDSFGALQRFADDTSVAAVHNFASATHPGGGFFSGARAQEESLCRESTLYASLRSRYANKVFYGRNRAFGWGEFYPDDMLYSPHVVVFRNDSLDLLEQPFVTSVFTLPAPNCSHNARAAHASSEDIRMHIRIRLETMFRAAQERGVRTLVLGAWGCGAFHIDPRLVAQTMRDLLVSDGWDRCFDTLIFAVRGDANGENFQTFRSTFADEFGENVYTNGTAPAYVR